MFSIGTALYKCLFRRTTEHHQKTFRYNIESTATNWLSSKHSKHSRKCLAQKFLYFGLLQCCTYKPYEGKKRLGTASPLFFAGEATIPQAYGTVHGAYQSGIRAAKEVLEWLKL